MLTGIAVPKLVREWHIMDVSMTSGAGKGTSGNRIL